MKFIAVVVLISTIFCGAALSQDVSVEITSPTDGSNVPQRPIIQGTVSEVDTNVWVVVHPLEVSDYWVQPRVTVRTDMSWKVMIHIGRPGSVDVGQHFEVRAVVNPTTSLREGQVLDTWPDAAAMSNLIELTRE